MQYESILENAVTPEFVEIPLKDGKTERRFKNGKRTLIFKNKTEKDFYPDGRSVVRFVNGDVKQTFSDTGVIVYYYVDSDATHTTYPDKTEVFEFSSGQVERHYPNGVREVEYADGARKIMHVNGEEENIAAT